MQTKNVRGNLQRRGLELVVFDKCRGGSREKLAEGVLAQSPFVAAALRSNKGARPAALVNDIY